MEASSSSSPSNLLFFGSPLLDESYRPLPSLYLAFLTIWGVSAFSWTLTTWKNRHFQVNNLQRMLATVPLVKSLQLALSFSFWYSCINLQKCSLWMSFGVYVTGILFQTASFISFMLISHGYCILYERLSVHERRITATLGCALYLTLVGYKAAVPYSTLNFIEDEDSHAMHDALQTKYAMLKKFQVAMQIIAVLEILVYINANETPDNYWLRLLVREWVQFCIILYIGWTFRTKEASPHFSVMPFLKSNLEMTVPPVYSIEIDAADFNNLVFQEWHVGVPTTLPSSHSGKTVNPLLVIVQNPHAASRFSPETPRSSRPSTASAATATKKSQHVDDQV